MTGTAMAATTALVTGTGVTSSILVDGVESGAVVSWEGGDPRVAVVTGAAVGAPSAKRVGAPALAPLVVRVAFPPSAPLASWINEVAAGNSPRHTVVLVDSGSLRQPAEAYEVSAALLTEIVLPAFDATKTEFDPMRLVFAGEAGRAVAPPAGGIRAVRASGANFSLSLAGLDARGTLRIEPIRIVVSMAKSDVGATRSTEIVAGATEISNLTITLSSGSAATWKTWFTDFAMNASGAGATKRDGAIALLDASMKPGAVSISLAGCGILRVSRPPETAGVPNNYQAEIFCERVAFAGLTAVPVSKSDAATALPPPVVRAPLAAAAGIPDKGARDPAMFPRVSGLIRTSYSGTYQQTQTSETATYTSTETANQLAARVEEAAKAKGWELRTLSESEGGATRRIYQGWVSSPAIVTLTFGETTGVAGSQLDVQVYVDRSIIK